MSSNLFKNEITDELITYMYIYLNVCNQITGFKLLLLYSSA